MINDYRIDPGTIVAWLTLLDSIPTPFDDAQAHELVREHEWEILFDEPELSIMATAPGGYEGGIRIYREASNVTDISVAVGVGDESVGASQDAAIDQFARIVADATALWGAPDRRIPGEPAKALWQRDGHNITVVKVGANVAVQWITDAQQQLIDEEDHEEEDAQ
jgi:Family of unknown function (DUF6301)